MQWKDLVLCDKVQLVRFMQSRRTNAFAFPPADAAKNAARV